MPVTFPGCRASQFLLSSSCTGFAAMPCDSTTASAGEPLGCTGLPSLAGAFLSMRWGLFGAGVPPPASCTCAHRGVGGFQEPGSQGTLRAACQPLPRVVQVRF